MAEAACDEEPVKKRARVHTKRFCAHCGCYVSKSTWYNHKHHVEPLNSGLNRQQTSSVLEVIFISLLPERFNNYSIFFTQETSEFEFSNTDSEEGESCNEDCEHTKENIESEQSEDSEFNFEKSVSCLNLCTLGHGIHESLRCIHT